MTEVLLIRHGQSANNALAENLRVPDPGLTEIGQGQAAATAAWLDSQTVDCLYCSPFLRSLETTRPLADRKQLGVQVRADLFELGGCYSGHEPGKQRGELGRGRTTLGAEYPGWQIDDRIADAGWWGRAYETWEQGVQRAEQVAKWLSSEIVPLGGTHVLVIHADFKRLLIEALLRPKNRFGDDFDAAPLFNTGVSTFQWKGDLWVMQGFNSIEHLPSKLVT